jgi:hypothetical protein
VFELPAVAPEAPVSSPPLADSEVLSAPAQPGPGACPRCSANLIDPKGLGWCKACGYCRSLEEERARAPLAKAAPPTWMSLVGRLPGWLWIMLAGIVVVVVFSLPPGLSLAEDGLSRCLWCTVQLGVGILMLLGGQIWALMVLADADDRLSFKDAFISGRLWRLTLRKLPETQRQLWLGTWGLATILSALFIIGGLSHWFSYLPGNAAPAPAAVQQEGKS